MIIKTKQQVASAKAKKVYENPARIIVVSFLILIIIGGFLLTLPFVSRTNAFTSPIDAFFTAISAVCVTGLIVVDTYTHFNTLGQVIILSLIQLGGIGLLTFTTFFNIALRRRIGLKSMRIAKESVNSDSFSDISHLMNMILAMTFTIELIGASILSTVFIPQFGVQQGIWISIFTSVSAFCNAGFDILGFITPFTSMTTFYDSPVVLGTIMALIISGGLGFIVWQNLYRFRATRKLTLHTKIVLTMTGILILVGTILFACLEWNNPKTIGDMTIPEKLLNSLFQSVTFRTAGFNSVALENTFGATKLFAVILMFIGAAPGSTGGGIKITTIVVLVMTVICVFQNKEDTIIAKRRVSKAVIYKSLAVFFAGVVAVFITTSTIFFTSRGQNISEINALFESVSAFATVGVSSGVTAIANNASLLVLMITMFLGRVGPVSLALSLAYKTTNDDKSTIIPEGKIMVG